jgi:hypothetical protein
MRRSLQHGFRVVLLGMGLGVALYVAYLAFGMLP